ncbi:MAG: hypothetical protein AAF936_10570 [Pseudomonadota bacterium]
MVSNRPTVYDGARAMLLLVFAIGQLAAGFLPDALGWDVSIASRSAEFNTALIPAGYAFVIWLPLFFGNIAFAVFHALPGQIQNPLYRRVGWFAAAAFAANTFRSLYEPINGPDWISFLLLVAILLPLLAAAVTITRSPAKPPLLATFPIYGQAGWITVATAAGFSQMALFEGWNPFDLTATIAAFGVVAAWTPLAITAAWAVRSFLFAAAMSWGLFWIGMANVDTRGDILTEAAWSLAVLTIIVTGASKLYAR